MKKIMLSVVALIFTSGAFAQLDKIEYGVKGGINIANISNMEVSLDSKGMKPGIYLGAFAKYRINDYLGVQAELIYSRQGICGKTKEAEGDSNVFKGKIRANYINIPILAKVYLLENLAIDFGPQFGFLCNSKIKLKEDETVIKTDFEKATNLNTNVFDFSIAMGATYNITKQIDVSLRYNLGITKIIKQHYDGEKNRNGVIQIGAGYSF